MKRGHTSFMCQNKWKVRLGFINTEKKNTKQSTNHIWRCSKLRPALIWVCLYPPPRAHLRPCAGAAAPRTPRTGRASHPQHDLLPGGPQSGPRSCCCCCWLSSREFGTTTESERLLLAIATYKEMEPTTARHQTHGMWPCELDHCVAFPRADGNNPSDMKANNWSVAVKWMRNPYDWAVWREEFQICRCVAAQCGPSSRATLLIPLCKAQQ